MAKKLPCPFCLIKQAKLCRHIERLHKEEPRVKKIIRKSESLQGQRLLNYRKNQYKILALQGCGKYNAEIRRKGGSELIAAKETSSPPINHLECPECYGLYKDLKRHKCAVKKSDGAKKNIKKRARQRLTRMQLSGNLELADLIASMQEGEIKNLISNDELLLEFASHEMAKITDPDSDSEDVETDDKNENTLYTTINERRKGTLRSTLRLLGRYVQIFRLKFGCTLSLLDTFTKKYVMYTHRAIRKLTKKYYHAPQARKIISTLMKVYHFAQASPEMAEKLVPKVKISLEMEIVNVHSGKSTSYKEITTPPKLPRKKDIRRFRKHLDKELEKFANMRKRDFTYSEYKLYCKYIIARVTLFNLRRSGEVASMSKEMFANRENADLENLPVDCMTAEQIEFAKEIRIVSLRGKSEHHQTVFAILTQKMSKAIKKVLALKRRFQLQDNTYVFSIKGEKRTHVRGNKAFETISKELGLENITAGKIRKIAATNATFEKDPRRKKLLSSILAHDLSTHHRVYEEHMCTGTARFFQVPIMLKYIEEGNEDDEDLNKIVEMLPQLNERREETEDTTSNKLNKKGLWSGRMLQILEREFAEEMTNQSLPITIKRAERCQQALMEEGFQTTISAVRARAQRLRKQQQQS